MPRAPQQRRMAPASLFSGAISYPLRPAGKLAGFFVAVEPCVHGPRGILVGKFTTFAGYEWTATPDNRNMHRNVIFKDSKKVPEVPFSALDSTHPEDLWMWMEAQRRVGNEALASPTSAQSLLERQSP